MTATRTIPITSAITKPVLMAPQNGTHSTDTERGARPAHSLDGAFAAVIRSVPRIDLLAERIGFPAKWLYRWSTSLDNASLEHRDPPAKAIVPLARATGRLDVVEFLARSVGCLLVALPTCESPMTLAILERVALITREFSDTQGTVATALHDGDVNAVEAGAIRDELRELMTAAAQLDTALAAVEGARKPGARAR